MRTGMANFKRTQGHGRRGSFECLLCGEQKINVASSVMYYHMRTRHQVNGIIDLGVLSNSTGSLGSSDYLAHGQSTDMDLDGQEPTVGSVRRVSDAVG